MTGKYFYHLKRMEPNPQAHDPALQDRLIAICTENSGVALPALDGQAIVPRNRMELVMKRNALILGAALALLTASAAHAQQSSRLSAEYLRQATPLIHWPQVVVKHDGGRVRVLQRSIPGQHSL